VLYDAHAIRSHIPRLFPGELPIFNIGTNLGRSCSNELAERVVARCEAGGLSTVRDGRFRGGWTIRHYGAPENGVHAIQMELAMRGYLQEPTVVSVDNWPPDFDEHSATRLANTLDDVLRTCLHFAEGKVGG
jgi:formiminoglutamase